MTDTFRAADAEHPADQIELTDEEREALDRLDMTDVLGTWEERHATVMNAAKRLLRENRRLRSEHPADDDDELVTEEWLLSIGFRHLILSVFSINMGNTFHLDIVLNRRQAEITAEADEDEITSLYCVSWVIEGVRTSSDIRRLCRALGVELTNNGGAGE